MQTLLLRHEGGVLHITLNRPELRNAMSLLMVGELLASLRQAEADGGTRVVVLRGAGAHFCAGADIKDMLAARARAAGAAGDAGQASDPIAELNAAFGRMFTAYARCTLPVVAVVQGAVMGGGLGLACVSDVTLAAADAVLRLPETSLGVVPAQIAPLLIERLGYAEAKRLAVTGASVDAATALSLRLVHQVAPDAATLDAALADTLHAIWRCAPQATAATKALLWRARSAPGQDQVDEAARVFAQAAYSAEGQEGMAAFVDKRTPRWAPAPPQASPPQQPQ